jgi:phosphoribosylglycinamide formyltransferase-1
MKKVAVLFSGIGTNLQYILENLHGKEIEVVVALTNKSNAGGIAFAKKHGIPLEVIASADFETREAFDEEVVHALHYYNPDLTVLAGFMRILTPVFTDQVRSINLHPSLLPRHKGLMAIERSYDDEFEEGGVTVHWVNSELDSGEVILQKEIQKESKTLDEYTSAIKAIEKVALGEGILEALEQLS